MDVKRYSEKPEMILFDVGGTLFIDGKCIFRDGFSALRRIALNPHITDEDTMCRLWDEYSREVGSDHFSESGAHLDFSLSSGLKYVIMNTGLRFRENIIQLEEIFDRFNSARQLADGIEGLLETLKKKGIRTAVISNNAMSGESLTLAVKRWLPSSNFEFCLTSSDILLAKPCKTIFLTAAAFAGVDAEDCWYCGDGKLPDVDGSLSAGMCPVLIDSGSEIPLCFENNGDKGEYMIINNWSALEKFINDLKD